MIKTDTPAMPVDIESSLARVRKLGDAPYARDLFGIRIGSLAAGRVTLTLDHRNELGHRAGWFQGSVTSALAELAAAWSGMTCIPADWNAMTLVQSISFVGEAKGGRLIAEGKMIRIEDLTAYCQADVFVETNDAREMVATMQQTNSVRPPRTTTE